MRSVTAESMRLNRLWRRSFGGGRLLVARDFPRTGNGHAGPSGERGIVILARRRRKRQRRADAEGKKGGAINRAALNDGLRGRISPPPPNGPLGRNQRASDERSCCDAYGHCRSGRIVQIRQTERWRYRLCISRCTGGLPNPRYDTGRNLNRATSALIGL